jgi:hypothetical protein
MMPDVLGEEAYSIGKIQTAEKGMGDPAGR